MSHSKIVVPGGRERSVLHRARRITAKTRVTPHEIKLRLYSISGVLGFSIAAGVAVYIAIWANVFETAASQRLAVFLLLGTVGISLLSIGALLLALWGCLLYEHVERVAAESDLVAPTAIAQEGIAIWYDPDFAEQLAMTVMSNMSKTAPALRIDHEAARLAVAQLIKEKEFERQMADLYCQRVAQRSGESELVRELQHLKGSEVVHA